MNTIPEGATFTITTGEYSDYCVQGVFKAIYDINPQTLLDEYLNANPKQRENYSFDDRQFLAFVSAKGLIEQVECFEWHLCDYGKCGEMQVSKVGE